MIGCILMAGALLSIINNILQCLLKVYRTNAKKKKKSYESPENLYKLDAAALAYMTHCYTHLHVIHAPHRDANEKGTPGCISSQDEEYERRTKTSMQQMAMVKLQRLWMTQACIWMTPYITCEAAAASGGPWRGRC